MIGHKTNASLQLNDGLHTVLAVISYLNKNGALGHHIRNNALLLKWGHLSELLFHHGMDLGCTAAGDFRNRWVIGHNSG